MKKNSKLSNLYLGLVFLLMYLPILVVIVFSFNDSRLTVGWKGFSLQWYEKLFQNSSLMEALGNSLILGVLSCLLSAVIGTLGAVGMAKLNYKSKGLLEYVSILPLMTPEIILGMVFLAFFSLLGLPFGMTTLIIAHTAFCIPYVYMLVKARLVGLDKSLPEAARDLGASEARVFFDITLPLIAPAIASGMLLSFAMSFDDVIISLFVTGVNVNTLPLKVYTSLKTGITPEINALCTLMLAFTVLAVAASALIIRKKS